jgi:hypothetical protein
MIALAIPGVYCLFEMIAGLAVLFHLYRRKTDLVRSRLSRVPGKHA